MKIKYIYILFLSTTLQACFVGKNYNRPDDLKLNNQFRSEVSKTDTNSIANISWRNFFSDKTLQSYIQKGLDNNLDIRIALDNIAVSNAYLQQAKAGNIPLLNAGFNYNLIKPSGNGTSGKGESIPFFGMSDLSGNLSWEADLWGKIKSGKKAALANYMRSVNAHQLVATTIVSGIANTYFNLVALDEQRRILLETITNREEGVETNKALKEAGIVTEVAVQQNEVILLNARELLVDTENTIRLNENLINLLMGENPGAVDRNLFSDQRFDFDISAGVPSQLLENRPDIKSAEMALVSAFENVNIAKANFYPSLKITASGGFQSVDFAKIFDPVSLFSNIVGGLAQPVYNRRNLKTQEEVTKALESQAFSGYQKALISASKEVSDALFNLSAASEKYKLQTETLEINRKIVEFSEDLLVNGYGNYLDVILAKQNTLNSQISVINSQLKSLTSTVELYRALGGGWK